jgi:hypothetical protein
MSWFAVTLQILLLVVLPLGFAAWIGVPEPVSRLYWVVRVGTAAVFLAFLWQTPTWHLIGTWMRWVHLAALVGAVGWSMLRLDGLPWWSGGIWPRGVVAAGLTLLAVGLAVLLGQLIGSGDLPDGAEPVELTFPLKDGRYYVVSGGSTVAGNRHTRVLLDEKFADYRGQAFAADIVQLNRWGMRASGLYPGEREAYAIYGTPVYAPCAGRVVGAENELPDFDPPAKDPDSKTGNFVFLACGDARVLLAHLRQGSLQVEEGDAVEVGDRIGEIGNSGNTTEPHLHIHAQAPADGEAFMAAQPRPMTFDGRFLTQSTIVDW